MIELNKITKTVKKKNHEISPTYLGNMQWLFCVEKQEINFSDVIFLQPISDVEKTKISRVVFTTVKFCRPIAKSC